MSSDNWNDIYQNGFGSPIDWDCCPVSAGIAVAMINAKKVALDIGREVYISKGYVPKYNERSVNHYRITTDIPNGAFSFIVAKVYPGGRIEYRKQFDEAPHD